MLDYMDRQSRELYQPYQNVAVDERMIKSKHRSGIRQFIPNKPTRFGIKVWCLCCAVTGYMYASAVYIGNNETKSGNPFGYDVVIKLCSFISQQGYHVYFDNFFTSLPLISALLAMGIVACGTFLDNRRGFLPEFKDKSWFKAAARGSMRWLRVDGILHMQWKDNKVCLIVVSFKAS